VISETIARKRVDSHQSFNDEIRQSVSATILSRVRFAGYAPKGPWRGCYAHFIRVGIMMVCRALLLFAAAAAGAQQISNPTMDNPSPFLPVAPVVPDTLHFEAQIPDFEAKDITGRLWRSADMRGKLTVIDIWGTFGGVHNEEHPELQRFYEKIKDSKSIQVLTFCTDYDYNHAPVYMKQRGYAFPVIADWQLTRKLFDSDGNLAMMLQWPGSQDAVRKPQGRSCTLHFPQQWVINAEGRLSARFCWWALNRILLEVERAPAGK
jgi:peroxiredoxin